MEFLDEYSSPSTIKVEEKKEPEPGNLLEQGWFFGNFLEKKAKMSRCYSDPSPSSNPTQEIQSSFSSKKKIVFGSTKDHNGRGGIRLSKSNPRPNGLVRAPSLPPCIGKIEVNFDDYYADDDEESDFTMGRLIRQASLNRSDILPPNPPKMTKPRRNSEADANKTTIRDDSECKHDVQCCKEMGFNFQKLNLNSGQGRVEPVHDNKRKSGAPRLPSWGVEKQNSTDMKAQIKFWARAVATNVRQEC